MKTISENRVFIKKNDYIKPSIDVVEFEYDDVITVSACILVCPYIDGLFDEDSYKPADNNNINNGQ